MNEVEKMYENAEVKKQIPKICSSNELYCKECEAHIEDAMPYCKNAEYPPFTAEKQIELIKWLCQNTYRHYIHFRYERDINNWKMECNMIGLLGCGSFEECFAGLINSLWQDLTDADKAQIKEILK